MNARSSESGNRPVSDGDPRRIAPSVARNRDAILDIVRRHVPEKGLVLEIASGTGEHIAHFAANLSPDLVFQPSDPDPAARASIDAWAGAVGRSNVRPAMALDVRDTPWPIGHADVVIAINMIHIAPWEATLGLVAGAATVLGTDGRLMLYGPFRRAGVATAASNETFDASLKARDPRWGLRNLEAVTDVARDHGFAAPDLIDMPANNLSVIFRRR